MKNAYILFTLLFVSFIGFGQNVQFQIKAPRVVEVGQQFRIDYQTNQNKVSNFNAPKSKDFNYIQGPVKQQYSSLDYVNGRIRQVITIGYAYMVTCKKKGTFTLPAGTVTVNGKSYKSNATTVTVRDAPTFSVTNSDLYLKMTLNKSKVYVGEPVIAEIKLYAEDQLKLNINKNPEFPQLNGFWKENLTVGKNNNLKREVINNKRYFVQTISKYLLFPLKDGNLSISPAELELAVQKIVRTRSGFKNHQEVKTVRTSSKSITVLPIPNNAPFIGDYKITSSITKDTLKTNESFTVNVEVSGKGNLKMIDPFKLNFPPDFEVLEPEIDQKIKVSNYGMSGKKTFSYLIIPRTAGSFKINPDSIQCFNPKTKKSYTLATNTFEIYVEKGDDDESITGANYGNRNQKDIQFLDSDIRHIVTTPFEIHEGRTYWFKSTNYYLSYVIALVLSVLGIFLLKRDANSSRDVVGSKKKKAAYLGKKRLKSASQHIASNDQSKFYTEVLNGLWGYLGDRLNIDKSQLSKLNIKEALQNGSVSEVTIGKVMSLIEKCEMAQYAPVSGDHTLQQEYDESIAIISNVEQEIQ